MAALCLQPGKKLNSAHQYSFPALVWYWFLGVTEVRLPACYLVPVCLQSCRILFHRMCKMSWYCTMLAIENVKLLPSFWRASSNVRIYWRDNSHVEQVPTWKILLTMRKENNVHLWQWSFFLPSQLHVKEGWQMRKKPST